MTKVARVRAGLVIGVLLLVPFATLRAAERAPTSVRFGFDAALEQVRGTVFTCRASLVNLETGAALFEPSITARLGEEAKASSSFELDSVSYAATLTVVADGGRAEVDLIVKEGEATVFSSRTKVKLAG